MAQTRGEQIVDTTTCPTPPPSRVFIAEDNILVSLDLEAILCAMGCEVVGVGTNVAQALQFVNPDKVDVAIIDYALEDGTCGRLIDALVAQSIPFVICTVFAPEEIDASYRGAPILRKPFEADEVSRVINQLVGREQRSSAANGNAT